MKQAMQTIQTTPEDYGYESITTTLYDLIEAIKAINEELRPGEEELLGKVYYDLAKSQKIGPCKNQFNSHKHI